MIGIRTRLALALVRRFIPDSDALAGDLIEEFGVRRSHLWLWRQVIVALALQVVRPTPLEIRPLRLIERDHGAPPAPFRPRQINLSASPSPSIGGLGIVAMAALVTVVEPMIWWAVGAALTAGVTFGVVLAALGARQVRARQGNDTRPVLLARS